jgi:DNA-binding CsgD family transcriptional regulator
LSVDRDDDVAYLQNTVGRRAMHLVVEPDTVKDHVQSIIKKLGATDRTHAAVIAVRGGIVS